MLKRTLLIIGFVLGGIGVGGSLIMLLTGDTSGIVGLLFWILVLLFCIKQMKKIDEKKKPATRSSK